MLFSIMAFAATYETSMLVNHDCHLECLPKDVEMNRRVLTGLVLAFFLGHAISHAASPDPDKDWPCWRGPSLDGKATADQKPPTSFSERKNVLWRVEVPGRGHSSPVIVGDSIFLATADDQRQIQGAIAFDRKTGRQRWITPIHRGRLPAEIHPKNTHASGTIACNGDAIFTVFFNDSEIKVSAVSVAGKPLWSTSAGRYNPERYKFGYGASPLLYNENVIVAGESDNGSFIAAFSQQDGSEVWRINRRSDISFSSPIVGHVAGKDQLLISGLFEVSSFDPKTGKKFWAVPGTTQATCGTMVWDGDIVFASGGYPEAQTIAVKADGSGEVLWKNNQKCYEQSMLAHNGYVYAFTDAGIGVCWRANDGQEMWKTRLGGKVSSSPILAGGNIYAANEAGQIFVFKASPDSYQEVTRTSLGKEIFATPTFVDNKIFYRVAAPKGQQRQEYLYCIGEE